MEKGQVVETGGSRAIFTAPEDRYTRKLMHATPRRGVSLRDLLPEDALPRRQLICDTGRSQGRSGPVASDVRPPSCALTCGDNGGKGTQPLLVVEKLTKEYPRKGTGNPLAKLFGRRPPIEPETFRAVDGISFVINRGESVGLVGESGCGKSTTSTMIMRLIDKTEGAIIFDGENIGAIPAKRFAGLPARKRIQMVFQDPTDSLNPRFTAARAIADPILRLGGVKGRQAVRLRCEELARQVELPIELLDRFPHQLSCRRRASASRAPLHSALILSSSTSRRRRSTSRCRPLCSICCRISNRRSG